MPDYPCLSSRDVEKMLRQHGFWFKKQEGSHMTFIGFIKGQKRRVILVAGKKDIPAGTLSRIIRQSRLKKEGFYEY